MGQLKSCQAETMLVAQKLQICENVKSAAKKDKKVPPFKIEQERQRSGKRINGSQRLNNGVQFSG